MGLLTMLGLATTDGDSTTDGAGDLARCRGCGRYYELAAATCPHCGSGNKLRSGPPNGQTRK